MQRGSRYINHRYFFPGHRGGLHAPSQLVKVLENSHSVFALDLPELDETDNIHAPEVSSSSSFIILLSSTTFLRLLNYFCVELFDRVASLSCQGVWSEEDMVCNQWKVKNSSVDKIHIHDCS
ncbi:hypothetical protein EON65_14560 [archaeon]|nr:MAG: hypothetical protein EON65_14560 [archaeon]